MKKIAYLIITLIIMMPLSGCLDSANNGEDGTNGEQGETGPQGPAGQDGVNGSDGAAGMDGADGQNGIDGQDGTDGIDGLNSLIDLVDEPSGDNCEQGGLRINSGLDDNRDGVLQTEEVDDFSFICQPTNGITIDFDEDAILGSWRSPMKHNSVTLRSQLGSCTEHDAWVRTNQSAMMEMMNHTNQNTYVAHVGGAVGGCEYLSMLDLLDAANHTQEHRNIWVGLKTVSYTHLTLPTICSV